MYSRTQRRILNELGIDLWVRRGFATGPTPSLEAEPTGPSDLVPEEAPDEVLEEIVEPGSDAPLNAPGAGAEPPAQPFTLDLLGLRAADALVIGAMPLAEDRRIARDLLGAVSGHSGEPEQAPFHWPQSSRGAQGPEAAATALDAFLRGQVQRADVRLIIVLGEAPRGLLFPESNEPDQLELFADARCLLTASAEQLRHLPERKRNLWHTLLTIPRRG